MRVALLSDIHANLVALDAVLDAAGSVDAIWHLGDTVGYGPDPNGVLARLAEVGAVGVRGNHDAAACGGREIEWFNPDARAAMEWTRTAIGASAKAWLDSLPESRAADGFTLVHGSPRDPIWEYITSIPVARANLAVLATPVGLFGHTHVPAAFRDRDGDVEAILASDGDRIALDGRLLVNPGSVGQPRDGDPAASFAEIDTAARELTWRRVRYDVAAVQAQMRRAGLPPHLVERLAHGL